MPKDARASAEKAKEVSGKVTTFIGKGCDHLGVVHSLLEDHSEVQEQVLAFLKSPDKTVAN
jgi:hypothetical protein